MAGTLPRTVIAGAVIALSLCGQAAALTVYDVIQLSGKKYSDDDIVALIQATDSAFELKAEDITQLMGLGVGEKVIQAMLKAVPEETGTHPVESPPKRPPAVTRDATLAIATMAGGSFAYEPFSESGAGQHHHSVVTLAGVQVLVLRDEGSFSSVAARAGVIVKQLNRAASLGPGRFRADHSPAGDSVMFQGKDVQNPLFVLKVSSSDAMAFRRRSGRAVTPALLAGYWSDLLSDYWSVAISRTAPVRLSDVHEGQALGALSEQWEKSGEARETRLVDAVRLLPRQTQQHLRDLATTIPRDYKPGDTHRVAQP